MKASVAQATFSRVVQVVAVGGLMGGWVAGKAKPPPLTKLSLNFY